jgi:hypothetical protein
MSKPITFKKGDLIDEDDSIVIWPEWSEAEVLAEKWGGKHVFEDGESLVLPRCIRKHYDSQKRASDIAGDSTSIVIVQPTTLDDLLLQNAILIPDLSLKQIEDPISEKIFETIVDVDSLSQGTSKLIVQNKHLLSSDFFLNLLSCIHYCYENNKIAKQTGSGEEFLPWDNIYPKAKDGLPAYNPSGKYMIKLFWLGTWRKIVVDDRIPVDVNGKPLLLSSTSSHEIWPLLLSKALMKLAHSSVTDESEVSEFGDFDIFTALRGWIPESLTFSPLQGMMAINTITAIWDPKKLEPVESEASSVSSPPATKAILKPVTPTIFLYRHQSEATKLDVNTLSIVYRIAEIQEVPESNTKEFLIRPYFSAGSKTSENADQWISEQMLCQVFDRAVVYHHPQHYRVTKSVMNIFDPAKVNENLKPIHVLYVPEESVDAGVIAMLCTHSKPGGSSSYGVNTVVLIEECQLAGTLQKKPVIRMCSNGYSGFFFKPQPGVGYRISFESSSSYSLNLYSKDEFVVEDEVKYLTEKHGFKVKEFEDVLPAQVAGSWAILFK